MGHNIRSGDRAMRSGVQIRLRGAHRRVPAENTGAAGGFTLLELMIVLAIIVILASMGVMRYQRAVQGSREAVLKTDLREMREAIQNYTRDKQAAPNSLDDLVSEHYLASIPVDPITRSPDWTPQNCSDLLSPDQTSTGLCDVHSSSDQVSPTDNTPYSSW
jgi:general secretion pathway protein G